MKEKFYHIKLNNGDNVVFSNNDDKYGHLLLCGFFEGLFGEYDERFKCLGFADAVAENNMQLLLDTIKRGYQIWMVADNKTLKYMDYVFNTLIVDGVITKKQKIDSFKGVDVGNFTDEKSYGIAVADGLKKIIDYTNKTNMKFDGIIQNPPYSKTLCLVFFEKGLELMADDGYMTIIVPSTFLINVRNNNKFGKKIKEFEKFERLKNAIKGHTKSIVLENLNKPFGTGLYMPFATITIDKSKTYDTIDFVCCGEHKVVKSIYDCNLVGSYETIWSILEKAHTFGDMMENHITNEDKGEGMWYAKYSEIVPVVGCLMTSPATSSEESVMYASNTYWRNSNCGEFITGYFTTEYHTSDDNSISQKIHHAKKQGASKTYTDKPTDNIYGTKAELENWKHFIFYNKLPLFINIVMTIDQNNSSKEFLPWLVDKQYTDEEINKMFGFTEEEIKLIDVTLKKYERNSPWFKRYMCGKDAVTDEDVNKFIAEINK